MGAPGLFLALLYLWLGQAVAFHPSQPAKRTLQNMDSHGLSTYNEDLNKDYTSLPEGFIDRRGVFRASTAAIISGILGSFVSVRPALADGEVESKTTFVQAANTLVRDTEGAASPLDAIDWNKPKKRGLNMEQLADAINDGLVENEWFVTGRGKPEYFDYFTFTDPQVSLDGFEDYCRGVRRLFDQETSRCQLVCCSVIGQTEITVLWRNSGIVNIGSAKINLKPYLVTTRLKTDPEDGNLVVSQIDEFDSDPLGLALYQIPFLRALAGQPAPPVDVLKQNCDFRTCRMRT